MKLKLPNNIPLLIGVIVFFILLLDYVILLHPQLSILGQMSSQIKRLSRDVNTTRQDIASIEQYKSQLSALKERIATVGERITSEEEIPLVLENISKIAKQTNLKITQIKPSTKSEKMVATSPAGKIYELPVFVEGRCTYHQLGRFINLLEGSKTFMDIAELTLVPSSEDSLRLDAKLTIKTYILQR